jgi:Domain of unknown function (DUF4350)
MKKFTITFALLLVVLALSAGAAELDPSTGLPATTYESGFIADSVGGNVLWDLTHGVDLGYEPASRFSMVTTSLSAAGFVITTTAAGVDNVDLSTFDVVVICIGSAWYSAYTPAEVAALLDFEAAGGGLLVLSENSACPTENLDPLLSAFNVTSGHDTIEPLDLYIFDFASHPIFIGINSLYLRAAGSLGVNLPAHVGAWTVAGQPVVAKMGECDLVVVGDMNWMDNDHLMMEDNEAFILNIMECLGEPGPVDTEKTTLEGLKSYYR